MFAKPHYIARKEGNTLISICLFELLKTLFQYITLVSDLIYNKAKTKNMVSPKPTGRDVRTVCSLTFKRTAK
jgi:hypothetical protein